MKILYISQFYLPELGAASTRVSQLAEEWAKAGHDVTILTGFPHYPAGQKQKSDQWRFARREKMGDIKIVRSYLLAYRPSSFVQRTISQLSFGFSAVISGILLADKPDVIIATSPPMFTGLAGVILSWFKRAPLVFEVRDLYPEAIESMIGGKAQPILKVLRKLYQTYYRAASLVVPVTHSWRKKISENYGIPLEKIQVIANGVNPDSFTPKAQDRMRVRRELNVENKHLVLYLGTLGLQYCGQTLIEAARNLKDEKEIHFLIVGDGLHKPAIEAQAKEWGLTNIEFLPLQPKNRVLELYTAADVSVIPMRKGKYYEDILPARIFESLSMEIPVIYCGGGEAKSLLEKARGGVTVPAEDDTELAKRLRRMHQGPELFRQMGKNGRSYMAHHFSRAVLAEEYQKLLLKLAGLETSTEVPKRRHG